MMRQILFLAVVLTALFQGNTQAPVMFAGVQDGQLSIFAYDPDTDALDVERLPTHPAVEEFDNLSWSPDGLILSFTQRIDPHLELEPLREELIFAPYLPEHQPFLVETSLSRNLQTFFTPHFDSSGYLTYVARPGEDNIYEDGDLVGVVLDVYKQFYMAGQIPQPAGKIVYGYGCGHTPSSPMEALQDAEGGLKSFAADTPFGIVFAPFCVGRGLALSTADTFTLLHSSINLTVLAPDQQTVAGWDVNTGSIVRYDLAAQAAGECFIEDEVTQLAWARDGAKLYYSTRYRTGDIALTTEEVEALNEIMAVSESLTASYGARLYAMTPETCDSELLYVNADAYAISRIQPLNEGILFSEIENGAAWFAQMLADGERDATREWSTRDIVGLNLYLLLPGGDARVIGHGIEKVTARP